MTLTGSRGRSWLRRAALVVAALLLAAVIFMPLWGLTLWSIQFPNGLRMIVYPTAIKGNISDINVLNHYIGMPHISNDFFPELKVLPAVFAATALICLLAAAVRRKWLTLLPLILLSATAAYGFWSMSRRLYQFGHDLDPTAAMTLAPFTPPIFGDYKIAQFFTYSYFSTGTTLAVVAGVLVTLALFLDMKRLA